MGKIRRRSQSKLNIRIDAPDTQKLLPSIPFDRVINADRYKNASQNNHREYRDYDDKKHFVSIALHGPRDKNDPCNSEDK